MSPSFMLEIGMARALIYYIIVSSSYKKHDSFSPKSLNYHVMVLNSLITSESFSYIINMEFNTDKALKEDLTPSHPSNTKVLVITLLAMNIIRMVSLPTSLKKNVIRTGYTQKRMIFLLWSISTFKFCTKPLTCNWSENLIPHMMVNVSYTSKFFDMGKEV